MSAWLRPACQRHARSCAGRSRGACGCPPCRCPSRRASSASVPRAALLQAAGTGAAERLERSWCREGCISALLHLHIRGQTKEASQFAAAQGHARLQHAADELAVQADAPSGCAAAQRTCHTREDGLTRQIECQQGQPAGADPESGEAGCQGGRVAREPAGIAGALDQLLSDDCWAISSVGHHHQQLRLQRQAGKQAGGRRNLTTGLDGPRMKKPHHERVPQHSGDSARHLLLAPDHRGIMLLWRASRKEAHSTSVMVGMLCGGVCTETPCGADKRMPSPTATLLQLPLQRLQKQVARRLQGTQRSPCAGAHPGRHPARRLHQGGKLARCGKRTVCS